MNIDQASEVLLSIEGVQKVLHVTKTESIDRWQLGDAVLAWHRPLRKTEIVAGPIGGGSFSAGVLRGEVLAIHVADLGEKSAWIAAAPGTCFDIAHFAKYPAVLIDLENAQPQVLLEIADAAAERVRH